MPRKAKKTIPAPIDEKIGVMRRVVQRFFFIMGLNRFLLCLLGIAAVDFFLDSNFRMDWSQRFITLVISSCVLGYILWRCLLLPLFSRISDDALLLQAEETGEGFNESLISALELSRMDIDADENISKGMVRQTIEEGTAASDSIELAAIFRVGRIRVNAVVFAVLITGVVGLCVGSVVTKPLGTWFNRNVMLGDAQWPQDYFLDITGVKGGKLRIPKGDDWVIEAVVRKGYRSLPEKVSVEFKTAGRRRSESMMPSSKGDAFRGELRNVLEPFDFRVISKEAETVWIKTELVSRPKISRLALAAVEPDYTGVGERKLPVGAGPYYLLNGTRLKVEGASNKPLNSALLISGETRHELSVMGMEFSGEIPAGGVLGATYTLQIEDREKIEIPGREGAGGLGPRDPARFKIKLKNDRKPSVKVALNGVGGMVVPGAKLPFDGLIEDDYAVRSAGITYRWKQDNSEREEVQGMLQLEGAAAAIGKAQLPLNGAIELGPLEIPVNSRLSLQFSASDNDSVSGPKTGESTKILLRVVGEAELRTDLLRREKEQRQILSEMIKKQDALFTDTAALAAECREIKVLDPSQRERLVGLQKRQKLMGSNLKPIVLRLKGMLQEIINNRLEEDDGVLKARLRGKVIAPLGGLQQESIPSAAVELDVARRIAGFEERNAAFSAAGGTQRYIIEIMREVLVHMVRNEGYQQAVNLLYEIQRAQERMRLMTMKAKEEALNNVLRDKRKNSNVDDKGPPEANGGSFEEERNEENR